MHQRAGSGDSQTSQGATANRQSYRHPAWGGSGGGGGGKRMRDDNE